MLQDLWKPSHSVKDINYIHNIYILNIYLVTEKCGGYGQYTWPNYNTLCVGHNGKTSGCNGDSGGPLVCEAGKLYLMSHNL